MVPWVHIFAMLCKRAMSILWHAFMFLGLRHVDFFLLFPFWLVIFTSFPCKKNGNLFSVNKFALCNQIFRSHNDSYTTKITFHKNTVFRRTLLATTDVSMKWNEIVYNNTSINRPLSLAPPARA
jgi:hypothetical protein